MRCSNCNKFASLEAGEVVPDVSVESDEVHGIVECSSVSGEVRIALVCADCGEELKETTFEVNLSLELEHGEECEGSDLDVDFEPESVEKFEPPNAKRQTHWWGAAGTATVECGSCHGKVSADWSNYAKSSEMDEL